MSAAEEPHLPHHIAPPTTPNRSPDESAKLHNGVQTRMPIRQRLDLRATLALIGATISWGAVPIMLRYLARPDRMPDGFTTNAVRYVVTTVIYVPFFLAGIRTGQFRQFWRAAIIPSIINIIAQTLYAWSPYFLDASVFAFLVRLCLVWSIVGAFIAFPDERHIARSPLFWIGLLLAIGGFVFMSIAGGLLNSHTSTAGLIIVLFCSVFWSAYGISVRYTMARLNPLFVYSVICVYSSVGLLAMLPWGDPSAVGRIEPIPMFWLLFSSVVGLALAHGLYYYAVQRIGVALCELMLLVTPFITVIGAHLLLGEHFTITQWLGGIVLSLGSFLAMHAQHRLPITTPIEPSP